MLRVALPSPALGRQKLDWRQQLLMPLLWPLAATYDCEQRLLKMAFIKIVFGGTFRS